MEKKTYVKAEINVINIKAMDELTALAGSCRSRSNRPAPTCPNRK